MDIVLKENVEKLGKKGDVVKVSSGYARNYILPRGLGVQATAGSVAQAQEQKQKLAERAEEKIEYIREAAEALKKERFSFTVKAGESGEVFGSVSAKDIEEKITGSFSGISSGDVLISTKPIKQIGTHRVGVVLGRWGSAVDLEIEVELVAEA